MLRTHGFTLVQLLIGLVLAAGVGFIAVDAITTSTKAQKTMLSRAEAHSELESAVSNLSRDFERHAENGIELVPGTIFSGSSTPQCQDLNIRQTRVGVGTQTIAYTSECSGPPFPDTLSIADSLPELGTSCNQLPRLVSLTTVPGRPAQVLKRPGEVRQLLFVCFFEDPDSLSRVRASVVFGYENTPGEWRILRRALLLGGSNPGQGIEIIPPQ